MPFPTEVEFTSARNEMRLASFVDGTTSRMQVGKAVARLPRSSCRKSQTAIPVASQDECVDPGSTRAIIGLGVNLFSEPLAMSDVTRILSQIESGDPSGVRQPRSNAIDAFDVRGNQPKAVMSHA